jgi:hypothetical protein
MTIEEKLKEVGALQCPVRVDVVDSVMERVRQKELHEVAGSSLPKRLFTWGGSLAAAAVVALLLVNVLAVKPVATSDQQLGEMIASLQDFESYGAVEDAALEPIDFLYGEIY